jgi:hypothetical protein
MVALAEAINAHRQAQLEQTRKTLAGDELAAPHSASNRSH